MRVVAVASRKGGSGKTTVAGHLSVEAERAGYGPVGLVDIDPQGSLAEWWNARQAQTPAYIQTSVSELFEDVERAREAGLELLVLDTPPALTSRVANAIRIADIILIPTRPSPHDLSSIGATVELVEHLGKPLVFVLNGATPRARITAESLTLLSQYGPLAPTIIHHRVDFAASMTDGRTVMEIGGASKAAGEIGELWRYVSHRLYGPPRPLALPKPRARDESAEADEPVTLHRIAAS